MKTSWLARLYRQVGVGLGLLDGQTGGEEVRSEAEIRDALAAVQKLKKFSIELRAKGVDARTVREWINEGRCA